ncbi:MAG: hypothetical protein IPN18_14395 [Ignavibacteriales bacterium]|nr:hypothetical protein [Ignavibacteriales bacterium]
MVTNIFINSEPDLVVNLKTYMPDESPSAFNFIEFSPTSNSSSRMFATVLPKDIVKCPFGITGRWHIKPYGGEIGFPKLLFRETGLGK